MRSTRRLVLQTLALALSLRWEPLDPRDLLSFLIHPVSPVDDGLRSRLARAIAESPGIGGAEWNRAIEEHREFLAKKLASDCIGLQHQERKGERELLDFDRSGTAHA